MHLQTILAKLGVGHADDVLVHTKCPQACHNSLPADAIGSVQ